LRRDRLGSHEKQKLNMLEYRLKANTENKGKPVFFANPSPKKVEEYKAKVGNDFKVVFYRTKGAMETYSIPFSVLENTLIPETLNTNTKPRWLTMIIDGILTVTFDGGKKVKVDISMYLEFELTTEVHEGDCSEMLEQIPSESVSCIITSPPYKEEDGYSPELMRGWLKQAYRILKSNSCMFVNFGHLAGKKERAFQVATMAVDEGFVWNDTIIWVKNHYTPLNVPYRVNNLTEFIFLLTKGKPKLNKLGIAVPYGMPWTVNPGAPVPENEQIMERYGKLEKCGGNVWYIKYQTIQNKSQKRHKDRFPVEVPLRALKLADVDGIVVDPFNGSGSTGAACIKYWNESTNKRINYIGFEINSAHIKHARHWWAKIRTKLNMIKHKEEGKCLRCGIKITDSNSLDTLVGPECRKKHWVLENNVKASVFIHNMMFIEDDRWKLVHKAMSETDSKILFDIKYVPRWEHARPGNEIKEIDIWINARDFCLSIAEEIELELGKNVEFSPYIMVATFYTSEYTKHPFIRINPSQTTWYDEFYADPENGWMQAVLHTIDMNSVKQIKEIKDMGLKTWSVSGKRIAYTEEVLRKMREMEIIYADSMLNFLDHEPDTYEKIVDSWWHGPSHHGIQEMWEEYEYEVNTSGFIEAHFELCYSVLDLAGRQLHGIPVEKYGHFIQTVAFVEFEECYKRAHRAGWFDNWESYEAFNGDLLMNECRNALTILKSVIDELTKHSPEKPQIVLTNTFHGRRVDHSVDWTCIGECYGLNDSVEAMVSDILN